MLAFDRHSSEFKVFGGGDLSKGDDFGTSVPHSSRLRVSAGSDIWSVEIISLIRSLVS